VNVLWKGKRLASVGNSLSEEFPGEGLAARSRLVCDLRDHEPVNESWVKIVDPDHLTECRKCIVVTQAYIELLEGRALCLITFDRRQPAPHQVELHRLWQSRRTIDDLKLDPVLSR